MCCAKSVFKRILPFFLTFAVGLFIASFFVTVAAPNFQFRRGGFNKHREADRQMRFENDRLQRDNECLRKRLAEAEQRDWVLMPDVDVNEINEVPPPPLPVAPPSMPMKTVPYKSR